MIVFIFLFIFITPLFSDEDGNAHARCTGKVQLRTIVECVLDHSPEYRIAKYEFQALRGQKIAAGYKFPSNPNLTFSSSHRTYKGSGTIIDESKQDINGELAISQEIYASSKRQTKLEIANSELSSQLKNLLVIERQTTAEALSAALVYKTSLEEYTLTKDIYSLTNDIYKAVSARAEKGLIPPIDADIAKAELIQTNHLLQASKRKLNQSKATLTVMMGVDFLSDLSIVDHLKEPEFNSKKIPEAIVLAQKNRQELFAEEYKIKSARAKMRAAQLEKIPNPTLSAFVMRDGFKENVIGGRVTLPLLIWRDNSGEIVESKARIEQSIANKEVRNHTIKYEVISAMSTYQTLKEEYAQYSTDFLKRVDEDLNMLKQAIELGQISIKDALLSQRSLISLKLSYIQTKIDYELSILELMRAVGIPMI